MQYFNFEENPEVRFPSNVCESVQEGISAIDDYLTRCNSKFEDSMSSTQNLQSPIHSAHTSKSTSVPYSVETGIVADIAVDVETYWVKMTAKCVIHQGIYKCNFIPMDKKLTGFIFNITLNDHECKYLFVNFTISLCLYVQVMCMMQKVKMLFGSYLGNPAEKCKQ
jgi:hypothetical protein